MERVTSNAQIRQTIAQIQELGLFDFNADGSISQNEQEKAFIEALGNIKEMVVVEDGQIVPFEMFIKLPFAAAKRQTETMSAKQRIEYLEKLDKRNLFLYEQTRRYCSGMMSKDEQMRPAEFRSILGKIKHGEILQNWLYGIY